MGGAIFYCFRIPLLLALLAPDASAPIRGFNPARAAVVSEHSWPGRPVASAAFSPEGRTLAVSVADDTVRLWSLRSWKAERTLSSPGDRVGQVIYSGDGRRLLAYSANRRVLRVFDAASGTETGSVPDVVDTLFAAAPSPDGRRVAVAAKAGCRLFDLDGLAETATLEGPAATAVFWSRDGSRIAAVQGDVRVHDAAAKPVCTLSAPDGRAVGVAFGPWNRRAVTVEAGGKIRLWDAAKGELLQSVQGHPGQVESVDWSSDGRWIATGGRDGTLRIWSPTDLREVRRWDAHSGSVYIVRFSPDGGTLLTGGRDSALKLWGTR